jgi:hypothetical protein
MTDRLTQIGEKAQGTVRHEDVCWMIDEIERLRVENDGYAAAFDAINDEIYGWKVAGPRPIRRTHRADRGPD